MIALVTGLTPLACFESGPLGTSEVDTAPALPDTAGSVDANPQPTDTSTVGPDTSFPPPDTGEPVDIGEPVDTGEPDTVDTADTDAPDTVDTADTDTADAVDTVDTDAADTADTADASTARPCLTVDDCDGVVGPGDLCGGVIGCVDYRCVVDPATVVTCPATGDPCLESTCEPATGICVTVDVCVCTPVGPLACATPVTYQTGAAGETSVVSGYSCPGASGYGGGPERVFTFDVATSQRVRVSAESAGVSAIFVVPRDAQGDCLPGACVAGGPVALFDAVGGTSYAVVVEHSFGGQAVTLRADCDITSETWCNDGLDDDGDGLTDCDDPDCSGVDPCPSQPTSEAGFCFDGIDNDGDGLTDCDDPDCWVEPVCLQSCSVTSVSVMCGFTQGASTGGGQTRMQDYSCHPTPAPGKEIVYRFVPPSSGPVTVTMSSGAPLALYLLADQGYGCTPRHCIAYGPTIVQFDAVFGTTYYVAIDAPAGVSGQYNIALQCDL